MEPNSGAQKLDIVVASERLRNSLRREQPPMIKDRRYHLRVYQTCFVGRDLVDWLIDHLETTNRNVAVRCMNILQDHGLIHHVCDDHQFKDQMLFYRFLRDDGAGEFDKETEVLFGGLDLYNRILYEQKQHLLVDVQSNSNIFRTCFLGRRFVDWLILNGEAQSRENGVEIGGVLLRSGLIKQLPSGNTFQDDDHYYQFTVENRNRFKLMDALRVQEDSDTKTRNNNNNNQYETKSGKEYNGFEDDMAKLNIDMTRRRQSSYETPQNTPPSPITPRSVMLRQVSVEELEDRRNPYVMTKISVSRDAVGYGFVVRGNMPVYVQTVDPNGPGAAAGVKIRQYIYSVNGKNVLRWSHKQVAEEILTSPRVIELVVMNHFRGS